MPIVPPRLDDRAYDDLVRELIARIPAHTPEWSNPQPGDPGLTLVELFAWLADTVLYRVNLIPDRQRLEFLRMLGVSRRGPRPARGLVQLLWKDLERPSSVAESVTLRPYARVNGPVPFETREVTTIHPIESIVFVKRAPSPAERRTLERVLPDLAHVYGLGNARPRPYVTTRVEGAVDPGQTVDRCLWIGLFSGHADTREAARAALGRRVDGTRRTLDVGLVPSLAPYDPDDPSRTQARPRPLVWELTTPPADGRGGPDLLELDVVSDGTSGATRDGVVRLLLPDSAQIGAPTNDVRQDLHAGVGARPPRLDDPALAGRLVAWLRLRTTASALPLQWVGVNAVAVDQRQTVRDLLIGTSDGGPDQRFALPLGGVEADSFVLEVEEEGRGWVQWGIVTHLALANRDERVAALDDEEGAVLFGDGLRGRVPQAGARVRVQSARLGGGAAGNLTSGALNQVRATALDGSSVARAIRVVQPTPTTAGADGESLLEAEARIPAMVRHQGRAVTADDYVEIATRTPGVLLGRVEVLRGFKPQQRWTDVPGVVSVMVLPALEGLLPPMPQADRHLIEAVYDVLSPRVPVSTELYVIGAEYREIGLGVGIEVRAGFDRDLTLMAVRDEVRRLLWPLAPGGPNAGVGWPLGRAVRDREIEVAISRVAGVDEVLGVRLFERTPEGRYRPVQPGSDGAAQVTLQRWQLPALTRLVVGSDRPGALDHDRPGGDPEVAVPVVPETC